MVMNFTFMLLCCVLCITCGLCRKFVPFCNTETLKINQGAENIEPDAEFIEFDGPEVKSGKVAKHCSNGSICKPAFERRTEAIVQSESNEPNDTKVLIRNKRYKRFVMDTHKAIDENSQLDVGHSLRKLVLEACELEKKYSPEMFPLFRSLYNRARSLREKLSKEDDRNALSHLESILRFKLYASHGSEPEDNVKDLNFIVNFELIVERTASSIEATITDINDVDLQRNLNELQLFVYGNSRLSKYRHLIEGFQFIYFPSAVVYLERYNISTSVSAYNDLDEITSAVASRLKTMSGNIRLLNGNWGTNEFDMRINPINPLFIWKNSDVRNEIQQLFDGKKITLLADVKQSKENYNAVKFNKVDLVFRSTDQTLNKKLKNALRAFKLTLNHSGLSAFRCNDKFYQMKTEPMLILSSFAVKPESYDAFNHAYFTLQNIRAMWSPFTLWEIQLIANQGENFNELAQLGKFDIDIELHGDGTFVDASHCDNPKLAKFYTQME